MQRIRPIRTDDLGKLLVLVGQALSGLTTLPPDRDVLARRIEQSEQSFSRHVDKPGSEGYLFVLEDSDNDEVLGICGIEAKTGGYLPFYAYEIKHETHQCEQLNIYKNIPILCVYSEHNGPSEVCSLFLSPKSRQKGSGRLLSLSRFLFMADQPQRFEDDIIAEMRGQLDEDGQSPFWNSIASHFIDMPYEQADYLSVRDKRFIGDLMPRHPIYVPLLPQAAQDVMGEVHTHTRPALALLKAQGFRKTALIDIFEAGPIVRARRQDIYCVSQSQRSRLAATDACPADRLCVVSNASLDFRCVLSGLQQRDDGVCIDADAAAALGLSVGDELRWVSAYPES